MIYAEIAVNVPVLNTFHYHVPEPLQDKLRPGHMVQVPFRTKAEAGIVLSISDERPADLPDSVQTKPVEALLHAEPVVEARQLSLARWIAQQYLSSIAAALWLMLPPGFTGGRDIRVTLIDPRAPARDMFEHRVINLLTRRGALTGTQISTALAGEKTADWRRTVHTLADREIVQIEPILKPPRIKPRTAQTAQLIIPADRIPAVLPSLGKSNRRADILEALAGLGAGSHDLKTVLDVLGTTKNTLSKMAADGFIMLTAETIELTVPPNKLDETLIDLRDGHRQGRVLRVLSHEHEPIDVTWVYAQTDTTLKDLRALEEAGYIRLGERDDWRDPSAKRRYMFTAPPQLTTAQSEALHAINTAIDDQRHETFLLHGVTGSGKTEIYLGAVARALAAGRTAFVLVPEIALTPQTTSRVAGRFPGEVAVLHSGLTDAERYDVWRRAREGLVRVVVGARSALFAPLDNIGVIVLDEEHDASYKQSPNVEIPPFRSAPHYHARAAAEQLARLHNAPLILGSATPDVETRYRAERGQITYLSLPGRVLAHAAQVRDHAAAAGITPPQTDDNTPYAHDLPTVSVVDMRAELKRGNTGIFSDELTGYLQETLARGQQAILFLNRRGKSTYVFCRDCGYVSSCPNCDTPLTYHHDGLMRCHRCGHHEPHPRICPTCGSKRIKFFGAGTQQVENALSKVFPRARVVRWDADTASDPTAHEHFLAQFNERRADIMVGTQMIAKGLDLPLMTLVGIVSADTALNLPDFRAGERSFQLLTQVAGRAGRSILGGRVVLQTYQPEHYAVQAASTHDYAQFYKREIAYRHNLGYPPFRRMARILFRYPTEAQARQEAQRSAKTLQAQIASLGMTGTELIGPAPCFFTRIAGHYRWHLLIRGSDPAAVLRGLSFDNHTYVDIDPVDVL